MDKLHKGTTNSKEFTPIPLDRSKLPWFLQNDVLTGCSALNSNFFMKHLGPIHQKVISESEPYFDFGTTLDVTSNIISYAISFMKMKVNYQISHKTSVLSAASFFAFLAKNRTTDKVKLKLTFIACFNLAVKFEELQNFDLEPMLNYLKDYNLGINDITKAEIVILNEIGWDFFLQSTFYDLVLMYTFEITTSIMEITAGENRKDANSFLEMCLYFCLVGVHFPTFLTIPKDYLAKAILIIAYENLNDVTDEVAVFILSNSLEMILGNNHESLKEVAEVKSIVAEMHRLYMSQDKESQVLTFGIGVMMESMSFP